MKTCQYEYSYRHQACCVKTWTQSRLPGAVEPILRHADLLIIFTYLLMYESVQGAAPEDAVSQAARPGSSRSRWRSHVSTRIVRQPATCGLRLYRRCLRRSGRFRASVRLDTSGSGCSARGDVVNVRTPQVWKRASGEYESQKVTPFCRQLHRPIWSLELHDHVRGNGADASKAEVTAWGGRKMVKTRKI